MWSYICRQKPAFEKSLGLVICILGFRLGLEMKIAAGLEPEPHRRFDRLDWYFGPWYGSIGDY